MRIPPGQTPEKKLIRFRTLGCYPLTGAIESNADTLEAIVAETIGARTSERGGRLIDRESSSSMEKKKREGYF
jgi:sulfate adenylyltransferase subunit 2